MVLLEANSGPEPEGRRWLHRSEMFSNTCSGGIAIGDQMSGLKGFNVMSKTCMASCTEALENFQLEEWVVRQQGWLSRLERWRWKENFSGLPCEPCIKWQRRSTKVCGAYSFLIAWQLKQGWNAQIEMKQHFTFIALHVNITWIAQIVKALLAWKKAAAFCTFASHKGIKNSGTSTPRVLWVHAMFFMSLSHKDLWITQLIVIYIQITLHYPQVTMNYTQVTMRCTHR